MDIEELQSYAYFALTALLVISLYGYIYHLYKAKKDADGVDYENYSNMALKDDIGDTPVSDISGDKLPEKGKKDK